ncbi:hypothetical protein [Oceanobacillus arenosus]|nr:hypothetical protein [Oceanobacillus arenosus]
MSDGKYERNPNQLDEDLKANMERLERKKDHIEQLVLGTFKSDPVRQDETFSIFVEVLRDWKLRK